VHRSTFIDLGGHVQPAPAPRFSRTVPEVTQLPANPGQHTREVLTGWGFSEDAVEKLISVGAAK
jgi:alpha-methylacyl-CoA racemase